MHQPASVSRLAAPAIDPSMLTPLLLMGFAFMGYFFTLLLIRIRADLAARKVQALRVAQLAAAE